MHYFLIFCSKINCAWVHVAVTMASMRQFKKVTHYAPMQYEFTAIFYGCKKENFPIKSGNVFLFLFKTLIVGTR